MAAAAAALTCVAFLFLLGASTAHAAYDTEAVRGQLIVGFTSNTSDAESAAIVNGADASITTQLPDNTAVVQVDPGQSATEVQNALDARSNVDFVEPNFIVHRAAMTNDPLLRSGGLWGLIRINAPTAWDTTRGAGVVVAVLDSGIRVDNPDLAGAVWANPNELPNGADDDGNGFVDDTYGADWVESDGVPNDDDGHGSHVAGTVAATGDDGNGVVGVAPGARVMTLKFLDRNGAGSVADAIGAIDYAIANGAKVINASWGGPDYSLALEAAIIRAGQAGIVVVAAAGNEATNNDLTADYPAAMDLQNIVSVAASDQQDNLASFSNYGKTTVDLAAPGVNILSTVGSQVESWSGTSMATPHVAGAAALLVSASPSSTADAVAGAIVAGASTKAGLIGKVKSGGVLDVVGALRALGISTTNAEGTGAPSAFRLKKPGKKVKLSRNGKVRFVWTRSVDADLSGYQILIDGKLKATIRGKVKNGVLGLPNTYADVKMKAGKHKWSVVAIDIAGNKRAATRNALSKGKVAVLKRG